MARHKEKSIDVVNVRLVKEPSIYAADPIKTPEDVLNAVANELKQYDREVFAIINLKTSGQIINLNICSVGTLNSSLISPREVFKSSILSNAAAFIARPRRRYSSRLLTVLLNMRSLESKRRMWSQGMVQSGTPYWRRQKKALCQSQT